MLNKYVLKLIILENADAILYDEIPAQKFFVNYFYIFVLWASVYISRLLKQLLNKLHVWKPYLSLNSVPAFLKTGLDLY
jgi:hypothetical protein